MAETLPSACRESMTVSPVRFFSHTRQSMGNWKEAPGPETVLYFVCGLFASKGEKPFLWAQLAVLVPQADEKCLRHRLPAGRNGINFTIFWQTKSSLLAFLSYYPPPPPGPSHPKFFLGCIRHSMKSCPQKFFGAFGAGRTFFSTEKITLFLVSVFFSF